MDWVTRRRWEGDILKWVPHTVSVIRRPRCDALPIWRVSNGAHRASVPHKRTADCSTIIRIPDSDGGVVGSRGDVPPIGRVSNGPHPVRMPLERISDCSTSLRIPDSDGGVVGSGGDVPPIGRVSNRIDRNSVPYGKSADFGGRRSIKK